MLAEHDLQLLWHLRHIRESLGVSQAKLAERMGVSQPALAAFESQGNDPKLSTIRRYAHALGVIVDHAVVIDSSEGDESATSWGSSQIIHLAGRSAQRAVARTGWH
ncbi:helix-turn-helix domain-containing protein [Microbacterium sp.]|uniref:helix-turn-helix domain-containing protein n=1 Tax=Microbacterium sp. TaxID=51671 RepID=UPI003A85F626